MKEKIEKLRKERNRLKKQKWQQNKAQMTSKSSDKQKRSKTTVDSPRTETEKMVLGSQLRNPNIKRALLFHNVLSQELRMNNETPVSRRRADYKWCHGKLALSGKVLRKYRLLRSMRQFGVSYKSMSEWAVARWLRCLHCSLTARRSWVLFPHGALLALVGYLPGLSVWSLHVPPVFTRGFLH